jgi:hypothetical protein
MIRFYYVTLWGGIESALQKTFAKDEKPQALQLFKEYQEKNKAGLLADYRCFEFGKVLVGGQEVRIKRESVTNPNGKY